MARGMARYIFVGKDIIKIDLGPQGDGTELPTTCRLNMVTSFQVHVERKEKEGLYSRET